jgi:hypothetical protein
MVVCLLTARILGEIDTHSGKPETEWTIYAMVYGVMLGPAGKDAS